MPLPVQVTNSYGLLGLAGAYWHERAVIQPTGPGTKSEYAALPYADAVTRDTCEIGYPKLGELTAGFHAYDMRASGVPIPYGAKIVSASIKFLAAAVPTLTDPITMEFSAIQPDGRWDQLTPDPAAVATGSDCRAFDLRNAFNSTMLPSSVPDVGDEGFPLREHATYGAHRIGQCIYRPSGSPGGDNVRGAFFRLRRVGLPGGTVTCSIYAARADDGSDDRPTGAALATSTTSVTTGTISDGSSGSTHLFLFSPVFTHSPGKRYCYQITGTYTPSTSAYVEVLASDSTETSYTNGSLVMGTDAANESATAAGWQMGTYGSQQALPFFRDQSGNDIAGATKESSDVPGGETWADRLGSAVNLSIPNFPSTLVEYEVTGLGPVLQAAVLSDSYKAAVEAGGPAPFGLAIHALSGLSSGQSRSYASSRIVATWIDRPPGEVRFESAEYEPVVKLGSAAYAAVVGAGSLAYEPVVKRESNAYEPVVKRESNEYEPVVRFESVDYEPED